MSGKIIVILGLTITVLFLCGCTNQNERGTLIKEGTVTEIEYDIVFGGTFTDWRDELHFKDGVTLWIQDSDLSNVPIGEYARYIFEKNYFEYDGIEYKFYKLIRIEYLN